MRWVVIGIAAALVALLSYGMASERTDTSIDEAVSQGERIDAPARSLRRLGGAGSGSLADYEGKVVVLNFWASWCPPCVDELPLLQRTHERIEGRDALVLGVNYQDTSVHALEYVKRFALTFPSLRDADGKYAEEFGSRAFPETFLIDREGRIAAVRRGPVTEAWLRENLDPLL